MSDPPLHSRGNFLDSVVELDRRLLDYIVGLDTEINELVDGSVISLLLNVVEGNITVHSVVLINFRTCLLLRLHWMMLHYQKNTENCWLIHSNPMAIFKR